MPSLWSLIVIVFGHAVCTTKFLIAMWLIAIVTSRQAGEGIGECIFLHIRNLANFIELHVYSRNVVSNLNVSGAGSASVGSHPRHGFNDWRQLAARYLFSYSVIFISCPRQNLIFGLTALVVTGNPWSLHPLYILQWGESLTLCRADAHWSLVLATPGGWFQWGYSRSLPWDESTLVAVSPGFDWSYYHILFCLFKGHGLHGLEVRSRVMW